MPKEQKRVRPRALPPLGQELCIELSANREAVIEGSRGVLEYSTECIRVNAAGMIVTLSGRGLNLRCISESSLIIDGYITDVAFSV